MNPKPRLEGRCALAALTLLTLGLAVAADVRAAPKGVPEYALKLRCAPSYLAGLPLVVAVELRNQGDALDVIPFFDLVTTPSPVAFELSGQGRTWRWPEQNRRARVEGGGIEFNPDTRWVALQDLSELHPDIPPGRYQLAASIMLPGRRVRSAPATVLIKPLAPGDRPIINRLRPKNDHDRPSWVVFLTENWRTPDVSGLSAEARQQLAFHLFLHRAAYGATPPAKLDPDAPKAFAHDILAGWAELSRLEILLAAGRPEAAALESDLRKRSPEFTWWVDQVRAGAGLIARFRALYGAGSEYAPKGRPLPYAEK
jgi:hypothetical protein